MDLIQDILARIVEAAPKGVLLTSEDLADIERAIRRDWGGERPYIAKTGQGYQRVMSARNRAILRDWRAGERVPAIARKWGLSHRRVRQILVEARGGNALP